MAVGTGAWAGGNGKGNGTGLSCAGSGAGRQSWVANSLVRKCFKKPGNS